jgi:hypothetical protein
MRHEGTGKVKGRIREEAAAIADCGLRIADLTTKNAARPAPTETGMGHRLTPIYTEMPRNRIANLCVLCASARDIPLGSFWLRLAAPFAPFCGKSAQLAVYQQLTTKIVFPNEG